MRSLRNASALIFRSLLCATAVALVLSLTSAERAYAVLLLNDTWADGNRTNTSLPSDSPTWIGQSAGNGSNSVAAGSLNYVLPTNSLKTWEYFTSNQSAPDGNQPHNAVAQLGVGDKLTASVSFTLSGVTSASTSRNFRFGLFFDPTDARVQSDTNSDSGGGTAPWTDATGYAIQFPINGTSSGTNPLQLGKRTTSNSSLLGSSGAFSFANTGGTAYSLANATSYTAELTLDVISPTQLDVTATIKQGTTVLTTVTRSDTGSSFGTTPIGAGLLPGSQSTYLKFDQLFFRNSDNSQATGLGFTNFKVELTPSAVPEASAFGLIGLVGVIAAGVMRIRRRSVG